MDRTSLQRGFNQQRFGMHNKNFRGGKYYANGGNHNKFNSFHGNNKHYANTNSNSYNNYYDNNNNSNNRNYNNKNGRFPNDENMQYSGGKTYADRNKYSKDKYSKNKDHDVDRGTRYHTNYRSQDDVSRKHVYPDSDEELLLAKFRCGSPDINVDDRNRRVILHRMSSSDSDDILSDAQVFEYNHDSLPLKSKSNVFNRLSLPKVDPYESDNFPVFARDLRGGGRERINSSEKGYYNEYPKREREFFSDFKEKKNSYSDHGRDDISKKYFKDASSLNNNFDKPVMQGKLQRRERSGSYDDRTRQIYGSDKRFDDRRIKESINASGYRDSKLTNRVEIVESKELLELLDKDRVLRRASLDRASNRGRGKAEKRGTSSKDGFYDLEEQEMLRKYIMDKLLDTPSFENDTQGKDQLKLFMENLGVSSGELKKYLDQELERRNDMDILQTSLRNLYRDKILSSFFKEHPSLMDAPLNPRLADSFIDNDHANVKERIDALPLSPYRRSLSPHDSFNQIPLKRDVDESRYPRGRSRSLSRDLIEDYSRSNNVYQDKRIRNRSLSPHISTKPSHTDNFKEKEIRTLSRSSSFESRRDREKSVQHEEDSKHSVKHQSHYRHSQSRSSNSAQIDISKRNKRSSSKERRIQSIVSSPPPKKRRSSDEHVSGTSKRTKSREHSVKSNSESPVKFDGSIEKMLIRAGDESVEQFKEEQVTKFISNKLHMVQSLNFIPTVMESLPFTVPVNSLPAMTTPVIHPSQQNILMIAQQQIEDVSQTARPTNISQARTAQRSTTLLATSPTFVSTAATTTTENVLQTLSLNELDSTSKSSFEDEDEADDGADEQEDEAQQKESETNNYSDYRNNIEETLSMLKKQSSRCNSNRKVNDSNSPADKSATKNGAESDGRIKNFDDEVTITRVVDSKKHSTVAGVVSVPYQRKVTVKSADDKSSSNFETTTPATEQSSSILKTKVRVPSWFNSRCIELLKKRHKKIQQLKKAKNDPNATDERLGSLKESLRDINREYIPLVRKRESEYMETLEKNNGKPKNDEKRAGSDSDTILDANE